MADQRLQPLEALYRFDDADIYLYVFISNGLMVLSYIYLYHIYVYIYIYRFDDAHAPHRLECSANAEHA